MSLLNLRGLCSHFGMASMGDILALLKKNCEDVASFSQILNGLSRYLLLFTLASADYSVSPTRL